MTKLIQYFSSDPIQTGLSSAVVLILITIIVRAITREGSDKSFFGKLLFHKKVSPLCRLMELVSTVFCIVILYNWYSSNKEVTDKWLPTFGLVGCALIASGAILFFGERYDRKP
jgi:NADH:ubiquinone oxidoreductase subunit 2 (subunit N)